MGEVITSTNELHKKRGSTKSGMAPDNFEKVKETFLSEIMKTVEITISQEISYSTAIKQELIWSHEHFGP